MPLYRSNQRLQENTYRVIVNECYKNKQVTCKKYKQFFCCHVLRFIVNVWTFTINTNLTAILLFFGSCDISTLKSNFSLQVCFAVVEGSDKMGNFEVRKSDLSKILDGRIRLNFSMIRRDITGTSFIYESPRAKIKESHRLKPQKPGGKGGQLPLMQIIAG